MTIAALLVTVLAGLLAVVLLSRRDVTMPSTTPSVRPVARSATAREVFGVLRTPSPSTVPPRVRRFIDAMDDRMRELARPNAAFARPAVPAGGDPRRPWFIVPGANALCLVTDDGGGGCRPLAAAMANRLLILQTDAPRQVVGGGTRVAPLRSSSEPANVIRGVAVDGVEVVRARTSDGKIVAATVQDNVYEIVGRGLTFDVIPQRKQERPR